tara:strand:- start:297 stop:1064 length:768 start_codon:yes stop_codon:yes gene_type:complete
MTSKYFTVEKKLTIAASIQHAGAFPANGVMVDWTAIQIPRGACILKSVVALIRAKGDAGPTDNRFAFDLLFSKTNTVSLGDVRTVMAHKPSMDYLGMINIDTANFGGSHYDSTAIATLGGDSANACPPLVLQGDPTTGDNVGFDTIYVAMIGQNASIDFQSINAIAEAGDAEAASTQVITMDGTSMDVREHFAAGDIVHIGTSVGTPAADSLIGTIATADSATQVTLNAVSPTALVDGDILYNINPVKLILGFEK